MRAFVERVSSEGERLYRDFPWRGTRDPYAVLVSEVMLQQTQVTRVIPYFERWMDLFPTLDSLAAAPLSAVLESWQGLGYNRRALALKRTAEFLGEQARGDEAARLPDDEESLRALPGIGPATAAGVLAFAYDRHAAYFETNVRTVFLHELFADRDDVKDREIVPLVLEAAHVAAELGIDARTWNYALLDYGSHLKRVLPNPSRRSAHHKRQSPFEGSKRQARARLLRWVMASPGGESADYADAVERDPAAAGSSIGTDIEALLAELEAEGFIHRRDGRWYV